MADGSTGQGSGGPEDAADERLSRLPAAKRRELETAVAIVREGFAAALARRTQERYREGRILKIVLFGSYARGGWVEDPIGRYYSDFDLLVVVSHEDLSDPGEFWAGTEARLIEALGEGESLRTPVSLIVHGWEEVEAQLKRGRDFFVDIVRDGIVLYAADARPFAEPQPLEPRGVASETQGYMEDWFESGRAFQRGAAFFAMEGRPKESAFLLHQAVERFYHGILLVRSLYSPKTHNLNFLRSLCEGVDERLKTVWPGTTKFERRAYELLKKAYVKSRYSAQYAITAEELDWLMGRAAELQRLAQTIGRERLDALQQETDRREA